MARYIDADKVLEMSYCPTPLTRDNPLADVKAVVDVEDIESIPSAYVEEVKHGEWVLLIKCFNEDTYDESLRMCAYILAKCPYCGENHNPSQVFSKTYYPPEDAPEDFRFEKTYIMSKALAEFKQKNYKFQNYCSNCGAKMDGKDIKVPTTDGGKEE